jgi:(1->4)-alpha-D-glucan 1-alpha-D-glucosylmutase
MNPRDSLPADTYRVQFHRGFTLRDATDLVPYLSSLGVSHLYASPLLMAMPGSTHGYDICDPTRINPELGSEEDLATLAGLLRRHRMGLVLDVVPNHMGIGGRHNKWWWDVLKHGRESRFARVFDIDWDAPGHDGKLLVPVLGTSYQEALADGNLVPVSVDGEMALRYFDHEFPLAAQSPPANADELDAVLKRQNYRLTHWRNGDSELNYRRFFTITSLVGVRVEDPDVFRMTHELLLRWSERGWIDGFRVDHPDGLRDPKAYLERLRHHAPDAWIIVEKILSGNEELAADWPVAGTTGYDFLNRQTRILTDPKGESPLTELYESFTGESPDFEAIAREAKREVLRESLAAEVSQLMRAMPDGSDRDALIEFIACFPVYRTYVKRGQVSAADRSRLDDAARLAEKSAADQGTIRWLHRTLLDPASAEEFTARFQQLTGPAMAKGHEDRAFYRYNRFIAHNEVGGEPSWFSAAVETFHQSCIDSIPRWCGSMLASSTHDTKRSEDVRARLCLLSEIPERWAAAVREWSAMNEPHRDDGRPDRNAEYLFYQTLVGAWPLDEDRAVAYMRKAAREAAQQTSWTDINCEYENALEGFIMKSLADSSFTGSVEAFVSGLLDAGWINSLSQTLLKLTAPGVPDIYQGTGLWDLSLVDPDNRRPVDFELRRRLLAETETMSPESAWERRSEGLPKLWLIRRALGVRRSRPSAFAGDYRPIAVRGDKSRHALAFMRGGDVIAIAPRLPLGLEGNWENTYISLPAGGWRNALTGDSLSEEDHSLGELLRRFPVALLVRQSNPS